MSEKIYTIEEIKKSGVVVYEKQKIQKKSHITKSTKQTKNNIKNPNCANNIPNNYICYDNTKTR